MSQKAKKHAVDNKARLRQEAVNFILERALKWKEEHGEIISRQDLGKFSCGAISPRTAANLDCLGIGIEGGFKIERKKYYPVDNAANFIIQKVRV